MLKSESTKHCRKRIEGYSEIVEYVSEPDSRSDLFRTERKCINCKWLITSLIIIIIFASGISWFLIQDLGSGASSDRQYSAETNESVRSNGTGIRNVDHMLIDSSSLAHDRKKRNISNETESEKNNPKSDGYMASLSQKYDKIKAALDDFLTELKKTLDYESRQRRGTSTEQLDNEPKNTSNFISFTKRSDDVEDETENNTRTKVTERISSTPDQNGVFAGVDFGFDHTETAMATADLNTIRADVPTLNRTSTSPASVPLLPTDTEPEIIQNHSENSPLDRDVTSSTKTTVARYFNSGDHASSIDDDENTATRANEFPTGYYAPTTGDNELPRARDNQLGESQNPTTLREFREIQITTNQPEYESSEAYPSNSQLLDDRTTKKTNIMKIPTKTTPSYVEPTTTPPPQILTTTTEDTFESPESAITNENDFSNSEKSSVEESTDEAINNIDIKQIEQDVRYTLYNHTMDIVKNSTSRMYLFEDIDQTAKLEEILNKIMDRLKREMARTRHSRETDQSNIPWYMLCYQKIPKLEGKFDVKFIKMPLNQSEIEKIPKNFNPRNSWPSYSAHSLDTHKHFQQYSSNNQTTGNITEPIDLFTLSSDDEPLGSIYYCTYSQGRDANVTDEGLETRIKSLLMNSQINWNELDSELCSSTEKMCADGSQCISAELWCDETINCNDFSDESNCTCGDRINADKLCDGYFDCPNGEDEQGCFDCSKNSFSCDDWRPHKQKYTATCVSIEKRCDNVIDCPNGKDEKDCEVLADDVYSHETFLISYTSGYLHRNWKGKWYPVCADNFSTFSTMACESELGVQNIRNIKTYSKVIPNPYNGKFVVVDGTHITLTDTCVHTNTAIHVDCPTEYCGSRVKVDDTHKYKYKREATDLPLDGNETDAILGELVRKVREEDVRVVGGKISGPGFWPWIVALYKNGIFHCGAAILDETWIVTAAHCVEHFRENYYEVQAGILRRLSFSPMEQNRKIIQVIVHARYSHNDMKNDVALLRVDPPLKMNRWIRPLCLPEARPPWGPAPGEVCTAVGWGSTREHGPDPDNMREVEVPILPFCKHLVDIQGHEICAGYVQGQHDTCQGDSGGPLLCRIPLSQDRWYLAGIVSHGEGCARPMEPGVYTRIAIYMDWIMKNTDDLQFGRSQQPLLHCPGMRCSKEGRCISRRQICDKVIDCLNGEDEITSNCRHKWTTGITDVLRNERESSQGIRQITNSTTNVNKTIGTFGLREIKKDYVFNVFADYRWQNDLHDFKTNETYVCKIIGQVIPKLWHCDGEVDCEDGSDEINCTCTDILRMANSSLICNGMADCSDWSDEANCTKKNVTKDDFLCHQSYTFINLTKVCDGKPDCPNGEDEKYCYALSDEYLNISSDFFKIPIVRRNGTIMENKNGTWKPYCSQRQLHDEMRKICNYLGFKNLANFEKQKILGLACYSIDLSCSNHQSEFTILPWFGTIYINGIKKCSGLLITNQWLIADYNCPSYNLQEDYLAIVLGGNRIMESKVQTIHEQIIRIDYGNFYDTQNATLMHLANPVNTSTHVKALRTEGEERGWSLSPTKEHNCFMIADLKVPTVISIISEEDCLARICPYRPTNKTQFCTIYKQNYTLSPLICFNRANSAYLTAAINKQFDDFCSTNTTTFSLRTWDDPDIIEYNDFKSFGSPNCTTHRCSLGNCLSRSDICDGKPDCRNNEDETPEICAEKSTFCNLENFVCPCKKYEFRCKNSRCVDRNVICDGNNDCGDGSDEPPECNNFSCATYLNMTEPSKLCDTRVDCLDKSDENTVTCSSICKTKLHFKCPKSGHCIPMEFVCDGESDCSDHEDERKCWKLINSEKNPNEPNLFIRKHGKWHKQCLSPDIISFRPDVVCKESNFTRKKMIKFIPGTRESSNEYTRIVLRNGKDFKLKAKPLIQSNLTEICFYVHLKCE